MADWDVKDLEYWDEKIREKVEEFGLSCYPQEFEICDHFQRLGVPLGLIILLWLFGFLHFRGKTPLASDGVTEWDITLPLGF